MSGRPTVYVETTIPSYLTSRASRDLIIAAHQRLTHDWWRFASQRYELYMSQIVVDEISRGAPEMATSRIESMRNIQVLPFTGNAVSLAADYARLIQLPARAINDAFHLAYATLFEMDYLVTWNMQHMANSLTMRRLTAYNIEHRLHVPLLVTPEYLLDIEEPEDGTK